MSKTSPDNQQNKITCLSCGKPDVTDWDGKGHCITCARDKVLGPGDQRRELEKLLTITYANMMIGKEYPTVGQLVAKAMPLVDTYTAAQVEEAEQKPVGAAIEIKVAPETMQAVMSKIRLKQKTIADRVLEPLWRVEKWCDGTADEYDLEIEVWKLRILASLTRRFNWAVFLLKSDNLAVVGGERLSAKEKS